VEIYRSFRGCRDFSFRDQIQRAAVSVRANIAEGLERNSPAECKQFMSFAKGSSGEVRAFLLIAEEVQLLDKDQAQRLREQAIRVSKRLYRFIFSLEARFQLKRGGYRTPFPPST
jgi:four helix bundle protein